MQEKRKNPRNTALFIDILHIAVGVVIVVMAVISFLNPEDHMLMFPVIFLLAAVLNLINGFHKIQDSGRDKRKKMSGASLVILGVFLMALCMISAISIWG